LLDRDADHNSCEQFSETPSIDRDGEAVLAEMMSQGAEFISGDVYAKHLLRNSSIGAEQTSGLGLITSSHLLEENLGDLPLSHAFLRAGWFFENSAGDVASARNEGKVRFHPENWRHAGDAPFNMQWQTVAEGKAKDKTERNCRL
jgi:uncharacterized protein YbjT (DUF2867 family)